MRRSRCAQGYDGTLLVVLHDRYLINKLADKIYYLEPDGTTLYLGNYDAYLEARQKETAKAAVQESVQKPNAYKLKKERAAEIRKKKSALARCEREVEEAELEIEELNAKLLDPAVASDYEQTLEITNQIAACKERSDALMNEWTALNIWLEENSENES